MKALGAITIATLIGIPLAAWRSFVIIVLWGWFLTPMTGWQPPALWTVAGLVLIVSLTHNHSLKSKTDDYGSDYLGMIVYGVSLGITVPAFALLGGFIFKTLGG